MFTIIYIVTHLDSSTQCERKNCWEMYVWNTNFINQSHLLFQKFIALHLLFQSKPSFQAFLYSIKFSSSCNLHKASLFSCHLTIIKLSQNPQNQPCLRINLIDRASHQISNLLEDQRLFTNSHGKQIGTPGGTVCWFWSLTFLHKISSFREVLHVIEKW